MNFVLIFQCILHLKGCRLVDLYSNYLFLHNYNVLLSFSYTSSSNSVRPLEVCYVVLQNHYFEDVPLDISPSINIKNLSFMLNYLIFALIEGQKKRRNTLHEFKKSAKTTLTKEDPLLKIKTKKMNSADECANRCIRNKGLPFTCK